MVYQHPCRTYPIRYYPLHTTTPCTHLAQSTSIFVIAKLSTLTSWWKPPYFFLKDLPSKCQAICCIRSLFLSFFLSIYILFQYIYILFQYIGYIINQQIRGNSIQQTPHHFYFDTTTIFRYCMILSLSLSLSFSWWICLQYILYGYSLMKLPVIMHLVCDKIMKLIDSIYILTSSFTKHPIFVKLIEFSILYLIFHKIFPMYSFYTKSSIPYLFSIRFCPARTSLSDPTFLIVLLRFTFSSRSYIHLLDYLLLNLSQSLCTVYEFCHASQKALFV